MKLTEQDKQMLRGCGHPDGDMRQLCEAARRCRYRNDKGEKLTAKKVIDLIGRKNWLYGISRAAFHWTSVRNDNGNCISFDCSAMFNYSKTNNIRLIN